MNISWQVHKAKETPKKTIYVSIFIILFLIFLVLIDREYGVLWALLSVVILFLSLNAYFLPTTFTLTDKEIVIDKKLFNNKLEWSRFRKYYLTSNGVVLSPFTKKNFLDNFRGIHLFLPKENAEEVINFIKNKLSPNRDYRLRSERSEESP